MTQDSCEFAESFRRLLIRKFSEQPHRKAEIRQMIIDARRAGALDAADYFSQLLHQIERGHVVLPGEYRGHRFHELSVS